MIYVYAITDGRPARLRRDGGFGGRSLQAVGSRSLAAVYSPDPPADLAPDEEALWCHEHVLEELMAEHAVLPLRFGSTLAGEGDLEDLLSSRADEFKAALTVVRGRVEMGVRASIGSPGPQPAMRPVSGSAYLELKLARRRIAAELGEEIDAELSPLARASTVKLLIDPRPAFAGAYLVDRDQVADFRSRCSDVGAARPDVQVACSGPWPPFSFAEAVETR